MSPAFTSTLLNSTNTYVVRHTHSFPASEDIIASIPSDTKWYAIFDCLHGYWQIPLDEESKPLTTFVIEFDGYLYNRAPMGLASSDDKLCRRADMAPSGLSSITKLVEDIFIFVRLYDELLSRICDVFAR
ncbi:unnamed protein product [Lepeophtheirus salmonis]|uniref:(salmon louse) hypothetical protein n=1 Tax=Lepeophtheirus salmonis TaxID=72036 RepID=A0A7R8CZ26_LEPSM|nr:unnamed protein product [Lepeophtheirus salmonis]CAF2973080.1 unnamed protein product [Lepeophtheirus salmonis]